MFELLKWATVAGFVLGVIVWSIVMLACDFDACVP